MLNNRETSRSVSPVQNGTADGETRGDRLPKRKIALQLGFTGTGYYGMQFLKSDHPTIEGTLFTAMCKAGMVSKENAESPMKISLLRAARTDAGVSAACNVVSLKAILEPREKPADVTLVDHLNGFLPADIRVWAISRTRRGFNPRTNCEARSYQYRFPSYVLSMRPEDKGQCSRQQEYRASEEVKDRIRTLLKTFIGTHNYWNYTNGRTYKDAESKRTLHKVDLLEPFVDSYGREWLCVHLLGASFLLHMIRKMMSMVMQAVRLGSYTDEQARMLMYQSFSPQRVIIPKAPGLGLLLQEPIFARFNEHNKKKQNAEQVWEEITMDEIQPKVDAFKRDVIFAHMSEEEEKEGVYAKWIKVIDERHPFSPEAPFATFEYLQKVNSSKKGVIEPDERDALGTQGDDVDDLDVDGREEQNGPKKRLRQEVDDN